MADLFDFNHGGATHPGAHAIVHSAADCHRHAVRYRVVTKTDEHIILDDGYTYDKGAGAVVGPDGRPTLQNCKVAAEGSAMFAAWSRTVETPDQQHAQASLALGRAHVLKRTAVPLWRLLPHG